MFSFKRKDDLQETNSDLIFLDLSESVILTKEDLEKSLSKIPNLKLKSDPIDQTLSSDFKLESIKSDRNESQTTNNLKLKIDSRRPTSLTNVNPLSSMRKFLNPVPHPMTELDLNDFCGTDIDWKMLTLLRPKTDFDEQYFSKMVRLYQLRHKTRIEDGFGVREAVFRLSRHPRVLRYKPISFTRMDSFGLDTNVSALKIKEDFTYEDFARLSVDSINEVIPHNIDTAIDDILSLTDTLDFKSS